MMAQLVETPAKRSADGGAALFTGRKSSDDNFNKGDRGQCLFVPPPPPNIPPPSPKDKEEILKEQGGYTSYPRSEDAKTKYPSTKYTESVSVDDHGNHLMGGMGTMMGAKTELQNWNAMERCGTLFVPSVNNNFTSYQNNDDNNAQQNNNFQKLMENVDHTNKGGNIDNNTDFLGRPIDNSQQQKHFYKEEPLRQMNNEEGKGKFYNSAIPERLGNDQFGITKDQIAPDGKTIFHPYGKEGDNINNFIPNNNRTEDDNVWSRLQSYGAVSNKFAESNNKGAAPRNNYQSPYCGLGNNGNGGEQHESTSNGKMMAPPYNPNPMIRQSKEQQNITGTMDNVNLNKEQEPKYLGPPKVMDQQQIMEYNKQMYHERSNNSNKTMNDQGCQTSAVNNINNSNYSNPNNHAPSNPWAGFTNQHGAAGGAPGVGGGPGVAPPAAPMSWPPQTTSNNMNNGGTQTTANNMPPPPPHHMPSMYNYPPPPYHHGFPHHPPLPGTTGAAVPPQNNNVAGLPGAGAPPVQQPAAPHQHAPPYNMNPCANHVDGCSFHQGQQEPPCPYTNAAIVEHARQMAAHAGSAAANNLHTHPLYNPYYPYGFPYPFGPYPPTAAAAAKAALPPSLPGFDLKTSNLKMGTAMKCLDSPNVDAQQMLEEYFVPWLRGKTTALFEFCYRESKKVGKGGVVFVFDEAKDIKKTPEDDWKYWGRDVVENFGMKTPHVLNALQKYDVETQCVVIAIVSDTHFDRFYFIHPLSEVRRNGRPVYLFHNSKKSELLGNKAAASINNVETAAKADHDEQEVKEDEETLHMT